MRHFSLLSLAFVAFLGGWPAFVQAQTAPTMGEQSTLAPGDSIRIVVWRKPELSGDFVVGTDGSITHPRYRNVKVAGLPFNTVEANVRKFLTQEDQLNPEFVVEPLLRVSVSGEVPRPQVFAAQPQTSIADAVARAGGTNQFGERHRIRVIRSERGTQRVFFVDLENSKDHLAQQPVRSGDQIVVDRRISFFRDRLIPAIGLVGSIAATGLLIDRISRND